MSKLLTKTIYVIILVLFVMGVTLLHNTAVWAANNGTLVGLPSFVAGEFTNALTLNGSTQYVQLPAGGPYEEPTGTTWAVSFWLKTTDASTGFHEPVSQGGGSGNWVISVNSGKIRAGVYNLTGPLSFNEFGDTVTVSDGAWHYVALYVTPSQATLYVDGVNAGQTTGGSYTIPGATRSTRIGAEWDNADYFNGSIDEVAFWSTGVTSTVGTVVPSAPYTGAETGLVALYHLDSDATDSAGGGSTLTQVVGVTSAAVHYSPGNWWGDTGRGGSVSRLTWCNGAYVTLVWSTTSTSPSCLVKLQQPVGGTATAAIYADGTYIDSTSIPTANTGITVSSFSGAGTHTCTVYIDSPESSTTRWYQSSGITSTGFAILAGDTPGTAPAPSKWAIIWADSTGEGTDSGVSGASTVTCSYAQMLSLALQQQGYDVCMSVAGGNGYLAPGDLSPFDIPGLYWISGSSGGTGGTYDDTKARWNKIVGGISGSNSTGYVSILDSNNHISAYGATGTEPSAVIAVMGINDWGKSEVNSDVQAGVTALIGAVRGAAPNAHWFSVVPFGMYNTTIFTGTAQTYITSIKAGVNAYIAAHPSDTKVHLIDFGTSMSNTIASSYYNSVDAAHIHFSTAGHQYAASQLIPAVIGALSSNGIRRIPSGNLSGGF